MASFGSGRNSELIYDLSNQNKYVDSEFDWNDFFDRTELEILAMLTTEADEEYDGDDNGWDGNNLEHNQGCICSDHEHCQHKVTRMLHYRQCQNDNEDLDENRNQEVNSTVSTDQYGESKHNGDYI